LREGGRIREDKREPIDPDLDALENSGDASQKLTIGSLLGAVESGQALIDLLDDLEREPEKRAG
jgi:hypothetical protein